MRIYRFITGLRMGLCTPQLMVFSGNATNLLFLLAWLGSFKVLKLNGSLGKLADLLWPLGISRKARKKGVK